MKFLITFCTLLNDYINLTLLTVHYAHSVELTTSDSETVASTHQIMDAGSNFFSKFRTKNSYVTLMEGDLFWPVKFGQLTYANYIGPRLSQNLTGQLVFTYFDTGGNYLGGKRHRNRAVIISCNKRPLTLSF